MDNKVVKSINLLPESLRTDKNAKFLSSTLDQLIQPPQLERIDGYIGSKLASTYTSTNVYISESVPLRSAYQLSPALIVNDSLGNTHDVVSFDDIINEINTRGGVTDNLDRLFRPEFNSYNPHIDWDKLTNFQNYYWLEFGPDLVTIDTVNIDTEIINQSSYTTTSTNAIALSNGMKISFSSEQAPAYYRNKEFIVEGVGSSIKLIDFSLLVPSSKVANSYADHFSNIPFDQYSFDSSTAVPVTPDYITINRASVDLNPWSRYNRWTHADVIAASAAATGRTAVYPADKRATRPIIEFVADLKLYNFGSIGVPNVDLIDTSTTDISAVIGSAGYYVDGVLLADNHRVIFNAVTNTTYLGKIYKVKYVSKKLTLILVTNLTDSLVTGITFGNTHSGTSWWQESGQWKLAQSHNKLNQAPLFDLFEFNSVNNTYVSYSDKAYDLTNFTGNKIFGYDVGTGSSDPVLGFPLKYKTISTVSNYLFKNYFMTDSFDSSTSNNTTITIPASQTYFKVGNQYTNVWTRAAAYEIPIIQPQSNADSEYYDLPLGLTNNPLNGPLSSFTLSELSDHYRTMITRSGLTGSSVSANISQYGTRLISNQNPIAFAQMFLGKREHNVLDAISAVADHYNQFKLSFLKRISEISDTENPIVLVDTALADINRDKNSTSPYFLSDMIAYGTDKTPRSSTVTNPNKKVYSISSEFNLTSLSLRSVLVYLNGVQLTVDKDYVFEVYDSAITILHSLELGDNLTIVDYSNTEGSFVPPTPSKLGLYPKYEPSKYLDDTYISGPTWVIQGHDGSITVAYDDYRDDALLEFEKRIFNNIKSHYRPELFDINSISASAFSNTEYTLDEITKIIQPDFIKWAGTYAVDYSSNTVFDTSNPFTWNYAEGYVNSLSKSVTGYWRGAYEYLYGTDRPHSHPWEMLGYAIQPSWWNTYYSWIGTKRTALINALTIGLIQEPPSTVINSKYARPNLSSILPVNLTGQLVSPEVILTNTTISSRRQDWKFGDQGPAETAWRRSSYLPFTIQRLLALAKPAAYAALMYDVSRITKNKADQWVYGDNSSFLNLKNISVHADNSTLTSGYSVYVSEIGKIRSASYITELKSDLDYIDFNLFYKVGGFVSKDKLQIVIDAYDPSSTSPGSLLPQEDCKLILNTSNPVKSASISGLIIQKIDGYFVLKGYNRIDPYFTVFAPIRTTNTAAMTIGGVSEPYIKWSAGTTGTGNFYQQGQIVSYGPNFYLTKVSHRSTESFATTYFQLLPELPVNGGATVQTADQFESTPIQIAYGTKFSRIQDVYDVIIGYGKWLENQGFIFDEYNSDLSVVLNWDFCSKEFLYWTTQNWATNSVITLSPFADKIKYSLANSIVDNIFDNFYEYSLLLANGLPFPRGNVSVDRQDGVCIISTSNTDAGIYFATLYSVQKEHALIFNNTTIFNDTIYDIETGYRQLRMKFSGFRTKGWNGDYFSPGFVYDEAIVTNWLPYTDYRFSDVVQFNGLYYSAKKNVKGSDKFDFAQWAVLNEKPVAGLLPNFDYKINQFEDFYSLDIDNFDIAQQAMAQHLTGYTPRVYLNNIFTNPIAQYKFYQGFIKEKGTRNSVSKLAKASIYNLQGEMTYTEEWAFRVGQYGSYSTHKELEIPLSEGKIVENPQIIKFIETELPVLPDDPIYYSTPSTRLVAPSDYNAASTFITSHDEFKLNTAGYVRLDDVTVTAYSENSLLDIANNRNINEGDVIWLGFKINSTWGSVHNDGWDVLRYTRSTANIVNAYISVPGSEITFSTKLFHGLAVGQVISISEYSDTLDGVYVVKSIPALTEFTVESELTYINSESLAVYGLLFEFTSIRFNSVDALPADQILLSLPVDTKMWVDNGGTSSNSGRWAVYQKTQNYSESYNAIVEPFANLHLGRTISKGMTDGILVVSATDDSTATSKIFVYDSSVNNLLFNYSFNESKIYTTSPNTPAGFGNSIAYDDYPFIDINTTTNTTLTRFGLIFAGAPLASNMKTSGTLGPVFYSTGEEEFGSNYTNQGAVKISSIDYTLAKESVNAYVLLSPEPANNQQFGHSLLVEHNTATKLLLVGAPGASTGTVYAYTVSKAPSTNIDVSPYANGIVVDSGQSLNAGARWGYAISGSDDTNVIAISAPGYFTNTATGLVAIYTNKNLVNPQIITGSLSESGFGETILVSPNGDYIFISAPTAITANNTRGLVKVYINVDGEFIESSYPVITNPVPGYGMKFGTALSINSKANTLAISSVGNQSLKTTFDVTTDNKTTYDSKSSKFYDIIRNSGTVYLYNRKSNRFILTEEVPAVSSAHGTNYGTSINIDDSGLLVGAPSNSESVINNIYQFSKKDTDSLKTLREQDDLVSVDTLQKVILLDSYKEELVDYLEVIDPLKGKISGLADQELTFRSAFDPAVYSIGVTNSTVDVTSNWLDEHVGELWWDLSTVKYTWYEQGELSYRKNSWGKLFPGSTIDVYEWIGSEYLPSEWAALADTAAGLVSGISGQPKYANNNVISVKQIYNAVSNSFSNYYFYWVKNKSTIPTKINRRISGYEVASIIADPTSYGLKYASILSKDAISLSNINTLLVGDRIHLNLSSDIIDNDIPRHTEWALLQENSIDMPPALLEKKLIDSLLGHDNLGNSVPDINLSFRTRYGIGIRPRQTLFKDRLAALRNLVEFANSVLIKTQIVGNYNFDNLNSQELIPDVSLNEYDLVVEDEIDLQLIDTRLLQSAKITVRELIDGKITAISIDTPGFGYINPPTVRVVGNGITDAVITTEINANGSVISAKIVDSGSGYTLKPAIEVRSYAVIVLVDRLYNGKWTKFVYNSMQWVRSNTQQFNTTLYWKYVDWKTDSYNQFKDFFTTLDDLEQLTALVNSGTVIFSEGQYVKIKNGGSGKYLILEKTASDQLGNFISGFDIVYSEFGTIQLLDDLWNITSGNFGFDQRNSYDQTLYDQTPDIELQRILTALKHDIFVHDLKINWNLFFFNAVKYSLSEQKNLDWAFKTSFINVKNLAGTLDQRPVYKLQDSAYYEQYLKEVKPYHTNIRNFTTDYTLSDQSEIQATDEFTSLTGMKFDRISRTPELVNELVTDQIVCNGYDSTFELSWAANSDRFKISVTLDGAWVLGADYTIDNYTELQNGYHKEKSKIIFLNYIPDAGKVLSVTYEKNIKLFNAVDRAVSYYTATNWMPPLDLSQVMTGITYPGTLVTGIQSQAGISPPFSRWDVDYVSYGAAPWATNVDSYHKTIITSTSTVDSNTVVLRSIDKVVIGQYANVISTTTNVFDTTQDAIVTAVDTTMRTVTFNAKLVSDIEPGAVIEFWNYDSFAQVMDHSVQGAGLDFPAGEYETIIDGDQFISPNNSYAPEELVPGRVADSLGINVYTKSPRSAPTIFTSHVDTYAGVTTTAVLSVVPMNTSSIAVSFNSTKLTYNPLGNFTTSTEYTIDWSTQSIILPPQSITGQLGYTILGIGGGRPDVDVGVIDDSYIITNQSIATVYSLSTTAKSAYVTVNGIATADYDLVSPSNPAGCCFVEVRNLPSGNNLVHAWFFDNLHKYFNVVTEQRFTVGATSQSVFTLTSPPGKSGPLEDKIIIEVYDGVTRAPLSPPYVSYYTISNTTTNVFAVDNHKTYASGTFTLANVRAYLDGTLMRSDFNYTVNSVTNVITVNPNILSIGAVVAVVGLPANDYAYSISGSTLTLTAGISNVELKVITYNDHDSMSIRTDIFNGAINKRYKLANPVINDNYVWVRLNGFPLTNRLDYVVMDDQVTIQLSDSIQNSVDDNIGVTSINSKQVTANIVGYRMFNDMFGRTHYKRLSKENTTYLTRPLLNSDTEITVADSGVLTPPIVSKKIPGVVIINGERIEFLKIAGNKLTQLRRGTLGTSPSLTSISGTKVIDQGLDQTIPFTETVYKQTHVSTSTNTFTISQVSTDMLGDGITLNADLIASDQVSVYYGGRLLRKTAMIHQDISLSFDSLTANIVDSIATTLDLPTRTESLGNAYIITSTNQIWIYTNSTQLTAINGYEYNGLNYFPPEFIIDADSYVMTLNIGAAIIPGINVTIIKKSVDVSQLWSTIITSDTTKSLLNSDTSQAKFLQLRPAELPDSHYYSR